MIRIPDELFESGDDAAPAATPMPSFAATFAQAREASTLTGASAAATLALHDLDRSFDDSTTDPAGWADMFESEAARIRDDQMARLPDPRMSESFARDFNDLASAKLASVRRIGAAREVEEARAGLDEALGSYAGLAAGAASDIEAHIVQEQAGAAIARMDQAGFLRPGESDELQRSFVHRTESAQIDGLIETDPRSAAAALSDPARFATLAPDLRLRLRDRAQLRAEDQEREQSQAQASERQGRLAGLMVRLSAGEADRAEIMESAAEGWLQPAERDRALALWTRQRSEIRQRDDDIARVSDAFDGTGAPIDPQSAADRRAVDVHFEDTKASWLAAGLQESQLGPVVVDYLGKAKQVPMGLLRDASSAFRAGTLESSSFFAELFALIFGRPGTPPQFFEDFIGAHRSTRSNGPAFFDDPFEVNIDPGFGIESPDRSNDKGFAIDIPDQSNDRAFAIEPTPSRWPWSPYPQRRPVIEEPHSLWQNIVDGFDSRDLAEGFLINSLVDGGWPRDGAPDRAAAILAGALDTKDRFAAADKDGLGRYLDTLVTQKCLSPEKRDEIASHAGVASQVAFKTPAPSNESPLPEPSQPELIDSGAGSANVEIGNGNAAMAPPAPLPAEYNLPETNGPETTTATTEQEPAPEAEKPQSLWEKILRRFGIKPPPGTAEDAQGLADNLQRFADKDSDESRAEAARIWAEIAAGRISLSSLRDENGNIRIGAYTIGAETADILERIEALDPADEASSRAISRAIGRGEPGENGLSAGQRAVLRDMLGDKVKTGSFRADNPGFAGFDIARLDEDGAAIEQRAVDGATARLERQIGRSRQSATPPMLGAVKAGGKPYVSPVERRQLEGNLANRANDESERALPGTFKKGSADQANNSLTADYKAANPGKEPHPPYLPGTPVHEYKIGEASQAGNKFIRLHVLDYPHGRWLVRREDVINPESGKMLTPLQLKDKLALPEPPTHYREVTLPAGTEVRMGIVNPNASWGKGRAIQYEILSTWRKEWFGSVRSLGE